MNLSPHRAVRRMVIDCLLGYTLHLMHRPTILAIEDDSSMQESYELMLGDSFDLLLTNDAERALGILAEKTVDLILLDILLPGVDGISVLTRLQVTARNVPVIVVSGLRDPSLVATAMKLGAIDYVVKPMPEDAFLALIQSALRWCPPARPTILLVGLAIGLYGALRLLVGKDYDVHYFPATTIGHAISHSSWSKPDVVLVDSAVVDARPAIIGELRTRLPESLVSSLTGSSHIPTHDTRAKRSQPEAVSPLACLLMEIHRQLTVLGCPAIRFRLSPRVCHAIDFLAQNYGHARRRGLEEAVGWSSHRLARLFRRETGFSPKRFLNSLRAEIAAHLLSETRDSLETIAEHVGFCDASHLSRIFLRHFGHRPGEHRRNQPDSYQYGYSDHTTFFSFPPRP